MQEVLLDANALFDLMDLSCLHAAPGSSGLRFWVVENVQREVTRPDQRQELERLLAQGVIGKTLVGAWEITWAEELATYAQLKRVLGDGEAASLAVAHHRGWVFVSYEKGRLRREAQSLLGERFWRTPLLLAKMVRAKVSTVDQLEKTVAEYFRRDVMKAEHLSRLVREARTFLTGGAEPEP